MRNLLKHHKLKLIHARNKKIIIEDTRTATSENGLLESGDWHKVTVDINVDEKVGIEGEFFLIAQDLIMVVSYQEK